MKAEREQELLEIVRDICHKFAPFERKDRYAILERIRVLEVNIERDNESKGPIS